MSPVFDCADESQRATGIASAISAVKGGRLVVLPTDTVYGVAALPSVPGATARLARLKQRALDQPLAVLVADADQVAALAEPPGAVADGWMAAHWPGPLTLVLRRRPSALALELGGAPATVGVRCPDHPFVRALAARVGPLATTSANRHGEPTPTTAAEAAAALDGPVDLVVDGGPAGTLASTVVDVAGPMPRILRAGALPPEELGLAP